MNPGLLEGVLHPHESCLWIPAALFDADLYYVEYYLGKSLCDVLITLLGRELRLLVLHVISMHSNNRACIMGPRRRSGEGENDAGQGGMDFCITLC